MLIEGRGKRTARPRRAGWRKYKERCEHFCADTPQQSEPCPTSPKPTNATSKGRKQLEDFLRRIIHICTGQKAVHQVIFEKDRPFRHPLEDVGIFCQDSATTRRLKWAKLHASTLRSSAHAELRRYQCTPIASTGRT